VRSVHAEDLGFVERAPVRVVERITARADAGRVFHALNDPAAVAAWWKGSSRIAWATPEPHGVGSSRVISPAPGLRLRETFIGWEPGRLWACTITASSAPLFARYVIRVDLTETGTSTELTWTSAVQPSWLGRMAGPLFARIVRRTIRCGLAGLPGYFDTPR
jgi:uncharacterized protein YndB with AHSA1/START domain